MPQSFNWPAIATTVRVVFRQPSLALPHLKVRDIRDVDFNGLRAAGCTGVVFDKDNTLTLPYADDVDPRLAAALRDCCSAFGPSRVAVLSNSAGTPDDPGHRAADRLERSLGLPVLRRVHKKPRGFEIVREHFRGCDPTTLVMGATDAASPHHLARHARPAAAAPDSLGAGNKPSRSFAVGDRYLTDVVFGNLHGMLCVHTDQLTSRGDNPVAKRMRQFEQWLVALWRWFGCLPPPHRIAPMLRLPPWPRTE